MFSFFISFIKIYAKSFSYGKPLFSVTNYDRFLFSYFQALKSDFEDYKGNVKSS